MPTMPAPMTATFFFPAMALIVAACVRRSKVTQMIPPKDQIRICFAHSAYQMKASFDALNTGIANFELRDAATLDQRIGEADVLVVSGMWHNGLIDLGGRLRFIQSIGSGTDQFDKEKLTAK